MYASRCHQKLRRLCYVTSPLTNLQRYHHFSILYEFYAAEQIQTIIKTESSTFSETKFARTYAVIFRVRVPGYSRQPYIWQATLWLRSSLPLSLCAISKLLPLVYETKIGHMTLTMPSVRRNLSQLGWALTWLNPFMKFKYGASSVLKIWRDQNSNRSRDSDHASHPWARSCHGQPA